MIAKTSKVLVVALLASLLLVLPVNLASAKKTIPGIDLTTFEGVKSAAMDINNLGQVIGVWYEAPSASGLAPNHAFVWEDGTKTDLAPLDPEQMTSDAMSINDNGQIAGFCRTPNPEYNPAGPAPRPPAYLPHAVMWTETNTIVPLEPALGVVASESRDINTQGQMVGFTEIIMYIQVADPPAPQTTFLVPDNAFLWTEEDGMVLLNIPLGDDEVASVASGINDNGKIVGYTLKPNALGAPVPNRAFIYDIETESTQAIVYGASITAATDLNNAGQVIGFWAESTSSEQNGFIWTAKTGLKQIPTLPSAPSGSGVVPLEINAKGQVAGVCVKRGGVNEPPVFERGFLWDGKKIELPPLPGDEASTARGLNDQGQVVGTSVTYVTLTGGYTANLKAILWNT
jgi:probable HAF family extracellular repeat protein